MALTDSKPEARSKTGSRAGSKSRPKADSAKRPANQAARARTARRIATGVAAASVVGLAVAGTARAVRNNDRAIPKLPAPGAASRPTSSRRVSNWPSSIGAAGRPAQPLTAPMITPFLKCFCTNG